MDPNEPIDDLTDALVHAGRLVNEHGSTTLKQAMRLALFAFAQDLVNKSQKADFLSDEDMTTRIEGEHKI